MSPIAELNVYRIGRAMGTRNRTTAEITPAQSPTSTAVNTPPPKGLRNNEFNPDCPMGVKFARILANPMSPVNTCDELN